MRWEILSKSSKGITSIKSITRTLLKNRNIRNAKEFFKPTRPEKIGLKALGISRLEVNKAIRRIKAAKKNKEKVIVYGDYDADGICGTAILWETLHDLGLDVMPYIPERFSEGYGLNAESIQKLKIKNQKLKIIITVDNGIVAGKAVEVANKFGIDVIITDHHLPGKVKPKAFATIHTTKIGGAAVAWMFSRAINKLLDQQSAINNQQLELVAIGTIADQLPLVGADRSFAKYGLEALNKTSRPGLLALFEEASLKARSLGPYEVGFIIAPRLNAMGRLIHAIDSLRLLCTRDRKRAQDLARHIGNVNRKRQKIVDDVVAHARAKVSDEKVIVLAHETYHEGVIGLAAAKLVEEFYRPAIVLSKKKDVSKASARSISGFNIIEAVRRLEDLYLEGGGHPMAAGFTIETVKIAEFTHQINRLARPLLTAEILSKKLKIDLELHFNQINWDLFNELKKFQPTGLGNPSPAFVSRDVEVLDARLVGQDNSHLKLKLRQESTVFDAIAFGFGNLFAKITPDIKVDIAYTIEDNSWNGYKSLQLKIKDLKMEEN